MQVKSSYLKEPHYKGHIDFFEFGKYEIFSSVSKNSVQNSLRIAMGVSLKFIFFFKLADSRLDQDSLVLGSLWKVEVVVAHMWHACCLRNTG